MKISSIINRFLYSHLFYALYQKNNLTIYLRNDSCKKGNSIIVTDKKVMFSKLISCMSKQTREQNLESGDKMTRLLYITANPNDESVSFGMAVGNAFFDTYKETYPDHDAIHLDLYKEYIPEIDTDVFNGWGKLKSGSSFDQLSNEEQKKVSRLNELSDQFMSADEYVFVTPLWNLSFPPVMKAYIDSIAVAGKTFKYTPEGQAVGLLTDKKALHIQARGGYYSSGPAAEVEMGHRYLSTIMTFFGVPSFEGLFVEGHANMPEKAEEIKEDAIKRAKELARNFSKELVTV